LAGTLVEQTYPSGRVVTNFTEPDGKLASIASRVVNAPFRNYATGFSYTPSGAIEHLQLGNGLWESAQFNSRLQVTEVGLGNAPVAPGLWRLNYHYGELDEVGNVDATRNAGNVAKQTISSSSLTLPFVQSYKYDSLDRIIDARETNNGNQTWRQTFGYDRYGNRTSLAQNILGQQIPVNSLTLPEVDPMTNRFREEQGYGYDAVGNLTRDPTGREFVFNGENKQVEVRDGQGMAVGRYEYDGNGKRIRKITDWEITVFVYDGLGKLIAEMSTAAPVPDPTINYTATDTLGSPRVVTNKQGEIVLRRDFMPFGEDLPTDSTYRTLNRKYGAPSSVRQKFTGYQRDPETGLDFAEARYYNQSHGRFTAVDPLLASGKSADPQTFNRYAYSMNRPTILTDPTGMQCGHNPDEEPDCEPPEEVTDQVVKVATVEISEVRETALAVQIGMVLNAGYAKEQGILNSVSERAWLEVSKSIAKDVANSFDPDVTIGGAITGPTASVTMNFPSPARLLESLYVFQLNDAATLVSNRTDTEIAVNTVLLNANLKYRGNGVSDQRIAESLKRSCERGIQMHKKARRTTPVFNGFR